MHEAHKKKIEEIMALMHCPKDFECRKRGFEDLCQARDLGLETFVDCLYESPEGCRFSFSFGHGHLCRCPLRVYLAKHLKK